MIQINNQEFKVEHFPDNSQCLLNFTVSKGIDRYKISWQYESDSELVTLMYIVNHIRNKRGNNIPIDLILPYIPNARMDRVKHDNEVFTLKYFANIINSLNFDHVFVLDAHSDVSLALINNVIPLPINDCISDVIDKFNNVNASDFVIYFPDAGAFKRYKDIECIEFCNKIYGQKVRDWSTGQILGLEIVDNNGEKLKSNSLTNKVVLMIDDIISYGGTLHFSAHELSKLGAKEIYAYATHTEPNSLWNENFGKFIKDIQYKLVKKLYTTNSIYNKPSDDCVEVINIF